jgi:hypothetical protein
MTTTRKPNNKWNDESRQAFADRNILRSTKVPNKKRIASRQACRAGRWDV